MESFAQGYRLKAQDLNAVFYLSDSRYYSVLPSLFSPYWVRYAVGYIQPGTERYYQIGPRYRLADERSTGVFRPNFIIGEDWLVGTYKIRWMYKNFENSLEEVREVLFEVETAGINNGTMALQNFQNLYAILTVID
jgi:hypothetical protein